MATPISAGESVIRTLADCRALIYTEGGGGVLRWGLCVAMHVRVDISDAYHV